MAQVTDRSVGANPTGFDMRTELNNIISALETDNSGSSEPLNTVAYMKWLDTSNATYYYLKERNHDNTAWVTLFRYTVATKIMEAVSNGVVLSQTNIASEIHASSSKTTPVDADEIGLIDSASSFTLKKLTWDNLKATIISSFGVMINTLTAKSTPVDADVVVIGDSASTFSSKKVLLSSFVGTLFGRPITRGTVVNSTSGTSIDFTSIPSWVKKITVMFNGVSTSGTSYPRVQLGSITIATTGYSSNSNTMANASTNLILNSTSGFDMYVGNASNIITGTLQFNLLDTNLWVANGIINTLATSQVTLAGGVTLSGTLDRIRVTTANGTDLFDAGKINIMYEG